MILYIKPYLPNFAYRKIWKIEFYINNIAHFRGEGGLGKTLHSVFDRAISKGGGALPWSMLCSS